MKIILDIGAANVHNNSDIRYIDTLIDEVRKQDTGKHEIIFKAQLFQKEGENLPLDYAVFNYIYRHTERAGYKCTASVFDLKSITELLKYDIPFIKIACDRADCLECIDIVPRCIPIYISYSGSRVTIEAIDSVHNSIALCCISEYPAKIEDYTKKFTEWELRRGLSDHTIGLALFKSLSPNLAIYEKHYVLEYRTDNVDCGSFAITSSSLSELL